ncbi:MAG TPA: TraR/DksA C4-type zinc finger protein [Longimicrobium sp.]|nr:TraR/DksA C4-type zinc finger protein [Longimicrobium sp.]
MLTEQERGQVEKLLQRERERILESIGHFDERQGDLREQAGELSAYRFHPADIGSESQEQEQNFHLASAEGRRLYEIDEALSRLYKTPEDFGKCEVCGRDIGMMRLEVVPETRYCADHAREMDAAAGVDANPREAGPPA